MSRKSAICFGILVFVFFIIAVLLAVYCCKDEFRDSPQPLKFTKQYLSVPGNCYPFMGCFFPSSLSNPVSVRTGKRKKVKNQIWCKKSWRDCNAYQDCVNGKCVPKKY